MKIFDLTIVGAGPVGLYAAYYAGLRGLSVHLIENFSEMGGQPLHLYPEKYIFDVAGLPKVTGRELTENLLEQLKQIDYSCSLQAQVKKIEKTDQIFKIKTEDKVIQSRSVLLTTGKGFLVPRKLGVDKEASQAQSGRLAYSVNRLEDYRDKKVAIFGGGDSAIDWALALENVASEVHLIHRREEFRAQKKRVEELKNSAILLHRSYKISELLDKGLSLQKLKSDELLELEADKILVFYGFLIESDEIVPGLELTRNHQILTKAGMRTNIPGLYAAGDVTDYEGKVSLISVGFGEAVIAVNAITENVDFDHELRNGYSSSIFE